MNVRSLQSPPNFALVVFVEVDEDLRAREDAGLVVARELGLLQALDDRDVEVLPDLRDEAGDALAARPVRAVDLEVVALAER